MNEERRRASFEDGDPVTPIQKDSTDQFATAIIVLSLAGVVFLLLLVILSWFP